MHPDTLAVITTVFEKSNNGSIHFGDVIGQLMAQQVESYHVDYRSGRTTYVLPDGATADLHFAKPEHGIAAAFDGDAVRAAIRGAQQGKILYPEFKQLTQAAGCIGYTVWIAGRHVSYYGRNGESHVEHFPQ
ncbi:DUF1398 domain-containing protein [Duganella qianjiadongensis]|uniref:DUF1398 domain-containing protein n=1 Tax=Duganella qianjiadongensis TaxID=2692176 RepID=A0ABW9VKS2_9BURK|nr:DUF1398 family protein [Duganella qianjiadongensis]MYM40198.1 DUF1398 domain-containing protein [Duganella qianjiadongensis]